MKLSLQDFKNKVCVISHQQERNRTNLLEGWRRYVTDTQGYLSTDANSSTSIKKYLMQAPWLQVPWNGLVQTFGCGIAIEVCVLMNVLEPHKRVFEEKSVNAKSWHLLQIPSGTCGADALPLEYALQVQVKVQPNKPYSIDTKEGMCNPFIPLGQMLKKEKGQCNGKEYEQLMGLYEVFCNMHSAKVAKVSGGKMDWHTFVLKHPLSKMLCESDDINVRQTMRWHYELSGWVRSMPRRIIEQLGAHMVDHYIMGANWGILDKVDNDNPFDQVSLWLSCDLKSTHKEVGEPNEMLESELWERMCEQWIEKRVWDQWCVYDEQVHLEQQLAVVKDKKPLVVQSL